VSCPLERGTASPNFTATWTCEITGLAVAPVKSA
jgi:hypothetical protein